jgi:hypothetical protein
MARPFDGGEKSAGRSRTKGKRILLGIPLSQVKSKAFYVFEVYKGELGICVGVERELRVCFWTTREFFARRTAVNTGG